MSEVKLRKMHTQEFKAKVGLEAFRGVKTLNDIGQEYGVHPVTIGQWKKEIQEKTKILWYSRRVLDWRVSNRMEAAFCVDCLEGALQKHGRREIFNSRRSAVSEVTCTA